MTLYGLLLTLIACGCSDRLILFPTTHPLSNSGLVRHEVTMQNGQRLEIWAARSHGASNAEPEAYVLSFIGNAARAELTAPFFAQDWGERPVEVWAVNYPGYGGSTGRARLDALAPAALSAYDELRRYCGNRPIILESRSIGTAASLYLATQRPVSACVLHNPPPLRELVLRRYGWWNLWLIGGPLAMSVPSHLDSVVNARRGNAPAVFILADADRVVPPEYQQLVANTYVGPKRVIHAPGADHTVRISGKAAEEYQAGLDWIWSQATKGR